MEEGEQAYFFVLMRFNTISSAKEKERCLAELLRLRKSAMPVGLKGKQMGILSAWWHVAIREMTALPDFKNSSAWVSHTLVPLIERNQAAASLRMLKKLGFIRKTQNGWKPVEPAMQTDPEVHHFHVSRFHREMIKLGMDALSRFSPDLREISGTTMRLAKRDVPGAKTMLQYFHRQMLDFASNSQDADQVYQLNFQFFPLVSPDRPRRAKKGPGEKI
jgi:uncharacterized protein (TIGR02147 family)